MVRLFPNAVLLFGLNSFLFFPFSVSAAPGDSEFQKEIATYDSWTVVFNFKDVSNPRCQVRGTAATRDMEYSGPVIFWIEPIKGIPTPVVEVSLFKSGSRGNSIPLDKEPDIQTLMITKMSVTGSRRPSDPYVALFNLDQGMVEKMAETNVAIATLTDSDENKHDLLILLKGFKEAWRHCERRP
ncbi:MAG: hypothetical protein HY204_07065 [Nitrospirae bacterium]|nr:hypothetical protein [Nitrospirota bacterium]